MENESPILLRLNGLMAAGYRIDEATSQKVSDAVWLEHPARSRAQEPTLILYSSGLLVSLERPESSREQLRIYPEQSAEFRQFLAKVPRPTLWEASRGARLSVVALLMYLALLGAVASVIAAVKWLFGWGQT